MVFEEKMKFTLVTTCFNEIVSLYRWKSDLEKQTRQPDEIVIVDALSTDSTKEALQKWSEEDPRLRLIFEKCNAARGRNLAIAMASHEHIVSTDMGVRLDPYWFEEIVKPFEEDPATEVVAGSYAVDKSTIKSAVARAEYYIAGDGIPKLQPGFVVSNRSVAYKRSVWKELKGLPEDLTLYADDSVFGRQILQHGYKMAFAPKALVYWVRPAKLREFWNENFRYGKGDGEAYIKTPIAFRLYKKGLIPAFLVPILTGVRVLTKQKPLRGIVVAIGKGDFMGCLFIPPLLFGCGYYFAKGYLIGFDHGVVHCQDCRSRLKQSQA